MQQLNVYKFKIRRITYSIDPFQHLLHTCHQFQEKSSFHIYEMKPSLPGQSDKMLLEHHLHGECLYRYTVLAGEPTEFFYSFVISQRIYI